MLFFIIIGPKKGLPFITTFFTSLQKKKKYIVMDIAKHMVALYIQVRFSYLNECSIVAYLQLRSVRFNDAQRTLWMLFCCCWNLADVALVTLWSYFFLYFIALAFNKSMALKMLNHWDSFANFNEWITLMSAYVFSSKKAYHWPKERSLLGKGWM